jgi:hypothetical protein
LGRKRPTAASTADTTANTNNSNTNHDSTAGDGNFSVNGTAEQNGGMVKIVESCLHFEIPISVCQYISAQSDRLKGEGVGEKQSASRFVGHISVATLIE